MIKGYHGWSGRALTSLSALRLVADRLRDFEIVVPLYNDAVRRECAALTRDFGLGIRLLDYAVDHADFLAELAACRVLVSIGISDGVATTALEALSLGVLPIQSDTACIGEWVTHGRTGFIVSPYDTRAIADALLTAATDDALVDAAAPINRETVRKRWNRHTNGVAARKIYRDCIEAEPVHV